ncbi:E3 ubiquitin-protein ligase RNF13, partial [Bienertia sinuspersici]
ILRGNSTPRLVHRQGQASRQVLLVRGLATLELDILRADPRVYNCVFDVVSESCEILLRQASEFDRKLLRMIVKIEVEVQEEEVVVMSVGDDMDCCSVCLEEFETRKNNSSDGDGDGDVAILPCSHIFHEDCLVPWIAKGKNTCPFCRYNLIL